MDPNANLSEQLELANRILDREDWEDSDDSIRLAELVLALDKWLVKEGFRPNRWKVVS